MINILLSGDESYDRKVTEAPNGLLDSARVVPLRLRGLGGRIAYVRKRLPCKRAPEAWPFWADFFNATIMHSRLTSMVGSVIVFVRSC